MHNGGQEFRDSGQPIGIDGNLGVARINQSGKPVQSGISYTEKAGFGCQLIKTEENPNTGRLRLTFRFDGINLGKTRFMVATTYLRVADSDSTIFARLGLGNNGILLGATFGDIVAWEITGNNHRHTTPAEFYIPKLASYNPASPGVSILSPNSLILGYPPR